MKRKKLNLKTKDHTFSVKMDEKTESELYELAKLGQHSRGEVVRRLISDEYQKMVINKVSFQ